MKIPTDHLFQLIHAMTASEKRYFKRHYSSEKGLTTELFDYINSMDRYDEEQVKKHFKKTKLSKNLKVYKVQLSKLLLKSLTSYYNDKGIRSKIRLGLEEVEILMNKQLFNQAYSKLLRIKKLCIKHEEFSYIPSILVLEVQFNFFYSADKISTNKYSLIDELDSHSETLRNIFRLKQINLSITSRHNHQLTQKLSPEEISFYRSFLKEESVRADDESLSFNERYFINSITAFIYNMLENDLEKEYLYKKKNVKLFENQPHFIENHTRLYFAALFNNLSLSMSLGKIKELESGIKKVKDLAKQYKFLERNLLFVYFLEAKRNFNSKNFKFFSEEFQDKVLHHIKKFKQKDDYLTVLIFIYLSLSFLALGKAQKVQFYLRRLHLMAKKLDGSYSQFFHTLELISHYETEDILIIQNLLASFKRKQKWSNGMSPFFREILLFFQELIKTPDAPKAVLIQQLQSKADNTENDGVRNLLKVFILDDWLNALKKNIPYSKLYSKEK